VPAFAGQEFEVKTDEILSMHRSLDPAKPSCSGVDVAAEGPASQFTGLFKRSGRHPVSLALKAWPIPDRAAAI